MSADRTTRPVTMADVAARAGVSKKTVSSVVNAVGQVRQDTRERVLAAVNELGWMPNPVARGLTSGRTQSVTLALPHLGSADLAVLASRVIQECERLGLGVLCEPTAGLGHRSLVGITDGILFVPDATTTDLVSDVPVVVLGHRRVDTRVDQVIAPAGRAIELLADAVAVGEGLVVIAETDELDLVPDRFGRRLIGARDSSAGAGAAAMAAALVEWPDTRGVVTLGTGLGIGAAHAARESGARIPADVRIASVGPGTEPDFTAPGITTAAPTLEEMVEVAVAFLRDRIEGNSEPARMREIAWAVTLRGSTAR